MTPEIVGDTTDSAVVTAERVFFLLLTSNAATAK